LNPPQGKTLCEIFMEEPTKLMHTYTTGPWHITKDTYTKVRDEDEGVIAIMSTINDNANAKLISAAPELLETLTWALTQIHKDLDPDDRKRLKAAEELVGRF